MSFPEQKLKAKKLKTKNSTLNSVQNLFRQPLGNNEILLIKITPIPTTIDDDEIAHLAQRQQRMMPNALGIIHPLPPASNKGPNLRLIQLAGRRHHHEIRL